MGTNNSLMDARQLNGLFEYLLVAHANLRVNEIFNREKNWFSGEFDAKIAAATHPHITLANFLALEPMEYTIAKWIQQIVSGTDSFLVTLDKFAGFPHHTIYADVQDATPFQQLVKKLKPVKDYIADSNCPAARFISKPHLTIARRLTEEVYIKAMAHYSKKSLYESFMVEELVLLRRRHQFDKCQPVQVFRFKPAELVNDSPELVNLKK